MMQVKFFLNRDLAKLAKGINCWLREYYDDIQVTDIKYNFIGDKMSVSFSFFGNGHL